MYSGVPRLQTVASVLLCGLSSLLSGCDLFTGSEGGSLTIVITPSSITFDALGATRTLEAEVRDENDRPVSGRTVSWSSSDTGVVTVSSTGLATAIRNGDATLSATVGAATSIVQVLVMQLGTDLEKVSGEGQTGPAGAPLADDLVVRAFDRAGNPAVGVPVGFQVLEGEGSTSSAEIQTDAAGMAAAAWTLGPVAGAPQSVRAFLSFRVGEGVNFDATAVPGVPDRVVLVSGDGQAAPRLTTLTDPLIVRVEDTVGNAIEGVQVEFAVIEGGGGVQPINATTDEAGLATTQWTLGHALGEQRVSVAVESLPAATAVAIATIVPEQMVVLSGDGQVGTVGERLPEPPTIQVLGPGGEPVPALDVDFAISEGGGLLEPPSGATASSTLTVRTDDAGVSAVGGWVLGNAPGTNDVTVAVPGLPSVVLSAEANPGPPTQIEKVAGDDQVGIAGTTLGQPLVVRVTDALGNALEDITVTFGSPTGDGSTVPSEAMTDSDGTASTQWTLASSLGPQSLRASIDAAAVVFDAIATDEDGLSGLNIELLFIDQPNAELAQAFEAAAARWAILIPGKLEPVQVNQAAGGCGEGTPSLNQLVDDVLVLVSVEQIDGIAGTLGQAGVCSVRLSSGLPIVSDLTLDSEDVGRFEGTDRLVDLIVHELAHALGFGTLWSANGLLENPSLPASRGIDTHFDGPTAIAAFDDIGGAGYTAGAKVPVENQEGGPGTRDSHWRLSIFTNEMMTGFLSPGANPLSRVTAASFADLGYLVDEDAADAFQLNVITAPPLVGEPAWIPFGDDVVHRKIRVVDARGRVRGFLD